MRRNAGTREIGSTPPRVLIVEDEHPIARALELKLTSAGFDPSIARDGEAALAQLAESPFSCVLLDLVMPKVDGFSVLETLRERKDRTPVIALTNLGQEEDRKRVIALGALAYLVKADTPLVAVVEQVRACVERSAGRGAAPPT